MPFVKTEKPTGRVRNRPLKDYSGTRFGRLVAVNLVQRDQGRENNHHWRFICDCGSEKVAGIKRVRSGNTTSCGCAFSDMMSERNSTHGLSASHPREYRSWKDMRARCRNPNDTDFKDYGGRGISVCQRWDSFADFFADMGIRPKGATLDRINTDGDYTPSNCRWASATTQANNKRSNRKLTINGETKTLQEWCRIHGLDHSKVRYRLSRGWSVEKAFQPGDFRLEQRSANRHG